MGCAVVRTDDRISLAVSERCFENRLIPEQRLSGMRAKDRSETVSVDFVMPHGSANGLQYSDVANRRGL